MRKGFNKDLTGKSFGRLTVLKYIGSVGATGKKTWLCLCECGNSKGVERINLTSGNTTSCGCLRKEKHLTHGGSYTKEYNSWANMIARCTNENAPNYHHYGGRGISVCDRWFQFENFIKDMGSKPIGGSLDRIDVDGDYKPSNCKWSTNKEQATNKRKKIYLTKLYEITDSLGIDRSIVDERLAA